MRADAEDEDRARSGRAKDDRGARRSAAGCAAPDLDELPQLFNVLRGDMSLVGPRPERPVFVEQFKHRIPRYMLRHKVKAGITGWAQVNGWRGNTSLEKRIEYDLYYIENWSVALDIKIIWLTVLRDSRSTLTERKLPAQETFVRLLDDLLANGLEPQAAFSAALKRVHGAFALAAIFAGQPTCCWAPAGAPLAVGFGEGEMFVGSDALALAPFTQRIAYLEEDDWTLLRATAPRSSTGSPVERQARARRSPGQWWARAITGIS